jgi:hypothetical protein
MKRSHYGVVVVCLLVAGVLGALTSRSTKAQTQAQAPLRTLDQAVAAAINDNGGEATVIFSAAAPNAPSALTLQVINGVPTLMWNGPTGGDAVEDYVINIYNLPRGTQGRSLVLSSRTFSTATNLAIRNPVVGSYCVDVQARNGSGVSEPSNEFCGTVPGGGPAPCPPPGSPSFTGNPTVNGTAVRFEWAAVAGATRYGILFSFSANGAIAQAFEASSTSYTLNVPAGTSVTAFARVVAVNACGGISNPSGAAQFTVSGGTGTPQPSPGTGACAFGVPPEFSSINQWRACVDELWVR